MAVEFESVVSAIQAAPLEPHGWPCALQQLGSFTGGWAGQLLGLTGERLLFDLSGGVDQQVLDEFEARGGTDPAVNPRATVLLLAGEGAVVSEPDFIDEASRQRHPLYHDFLDQAGSPYFAGAVVAAGPNLRVVAASLRTARQGPAQEADRQRLSALLPHLRAAARLQVRIEDQAAAMALGAFDRMALPALLLDGSGQVLGTTAHAGRMLSEGVFLTQSGRSLRALAPACDRDLQAAIDAARRPDAASQAVTPVLLASRDRSHILGADVFRLPAGGPFDVEARVMVVLGSRLRRRGALLARLGLTPSEIEIGLGVFDGARPADIAKARGVSIETVRSQLKSVLAKLGAHHKSHLVSKLRDVV